MNLTEVYRAYGDDSETGAQARRLLDQQHWYASVAEFDPKTGVALPLGFDEVVHRIASRHESTEIRDRLWRIVHHCRLSLEHLFASLSENPRREQAYLPIRDVKELNASSFIALSRRPGRNIREKLADKPYMQAVRRYQSVDLPQNRLVKEFVTRLADLLELRKRYLDREDDLLGDISRWLRSDDAQLIGRWDNLPPNNTLLSHRDYRRVWDAWRWLQVLDDTIERDFIQIDARAITVATWEAFGKAYSEGKTLFGDMPILFDYDSFAIKPWREPVLRATESTNRPDLSRPAVDSPACVDLTYLRPRFATIESQAPSTSAETYLWQRWRSGNDSVDLELFSADIALLDPDATSLSVADLFFSQDADQSQLDWAAHTFARKLSKTFTDPALLWLVPDFLNDFQLQVARRNINARFAEAEPLPRSVAAVFDQIDHTKIKSAGFQVVVVDQTGGTTYATKLIARYDADLLERVPETRGFYWERSPHVTLQHDVADYDALVEIPRVGRDGEWNDQTSLIGLQRVSEEALRRHPQVGQFDACITVPDSPVRGGARLQALQARAGDIPLWRDQIPELSIRVIKDGRRQPFYLVSTNTTIRPIRGIAVQIPVTESFTLRAGQAHYEFPLFQGDATSDLGYEANLKGSAFPLETDTVCLLDLTYTYGADDPYRLRFRPVDGSFPPVVATWRPMSERLPVDLDTLPVPSFPAPSSWDDLARWPRLQPDPRTGATESDLLEWITTALEFLDPHLQAQKKDERRVQNHLRRVMTERTQGSFQWGTRNKNGRYYCRVEVDGESIYCHESHFLEPIDEHALTAGDPVFLNVERRTDQPAGRFISYSEGTPPSLEASIRSTLERKDDVSSSFDYERARTSIFNARFPSYTVWRHGRSIRESQCPAAFRRAIGKGIADANRLLGDIATPSNLKDELFFLLCRMHGDAPPDVQRRLLHLAQRPNLDPPMQAQIAYSLGACTQDWQRKILDALLTEKVAGSIWMLSIAFWRSPEPIRYLTVPQLRDVLTVLQGQLTAHAESVVRADSRHKLATGLELLLALLRTRESTDPAMKRLLSPDSEHGRKFTELIDKITDEVARADVDISSRVDLQVAKPREFARIPDLLYVLRLYLTGDDGASAVRITGVADE
jgi:hypothetical protein